MPFVYYFFYVDDTIAAIVVTYPSSTEVGSARHVYTACDFEAKLEDVNFDGLDDLVIFLGHSGAQGAMVHCFTNMNERKSVSDYIYKKYLPKFYKYLIESIWLVM